MLHLFIVGPNHLDYLSTTRCLFQSGVTPIMEGITNLHNDIMFFMFAILTGVFAMIAVTYHEFIVTKNSRPSSNAHGALIEIIWTITPTLILLLIAFPTFALIYSLDEGITPELSLKIIGNQWYWYYELSDFSDYDISFTSYMLNDDSLANYTDKRVLSVDNPVYLPINTHIRFLLTAADVIHSWAVPAMGLKMDALPGRLNQMFTFINTPGVFYGQCSEICGVNHGFMPIEIRSVDAKSFVDWVEMVSKA